MDPAPNRTPLTWKGIDILVPFYIPLSAIEEFFERAQIPDDPNACWEWDGKKHGGGYGTIAFKCSCYRAHRFAYDLLVGDLIEGLHIHHTCSNRGCVNPRHLQQVTVQDHIKNLTPMSISAINSRKEFCPRGHKLAGDNLRSSVDGHRRCLTCVREASAAKYNARREARGPKTKTHCKFGHEWVDENILTDAYGRQHCKICRKSAAGTWYERKKANADPLREKRTTHCKRGHELTPDNIYKWVSSTTHKECWMCRQCKKDYAKSYKRKTA